MKDQKTHWEKQWKSQLKTHQIEIIAGNCGTLNAYGPTYSDRYLTFPTYNNHNLN